MFVSKQKSLNTLIETNYLTIGYIKVESVLLSIEVLSQCRCFVGNMKFFIYIMTMAFYSF